MGKKSTSRKQALPSDDAARAAAAACGVSASIVYALTAAASVGGGDSGELLAEACVGGVAHPPGYGLWLELAAAAFAPDPTRAARRASLMSALCGAAAVWGCARAAATWARHLDDGRHGASAPPDIATRFRPALLGRAAERVGAPRGEERPQPRERRLVDGCGVGVGRERGGLVGDGRGGRGAQGGEEEKFSSHFSR